MVARIVYRRKNGWRAGKHVYYAAGTLVELEEYARSKARGAEYAVQPVENAGRVLWLAKNNAVYGLDDQKFMGEVL